MVGKRLAHYTILSKIGSGGMGEVYLAEDTKLRRQVAIKVLPPALVNDPERRARFLREARAAAAIQHRHVGAIHAVEEEEGGLFLVMEYVPGASLRELLRQGPMAPPRAARLLRQLATGLSRVHDAGIVHRDLKPENVIIGDMDEAKIIDFGLAKTVAATPSPGRVEEEETHFQTRAGAILGTVSYMSPEQASGDRVDPQSDLFSLGVIFHEMLTGQSPFRRPSPVESLHAILKEPAPPLPPQTPVALVEVARRLLEKDPALRYASASELEAALDGGASVTAMDRVAVAASRSRFVRPSVAVLGITIAAAALWFSRGAGPPRATEAPSASSVRIGSKTEAVLETRTPVLAVLQFADHTGRPDLRWLGTGLPSMLLTGLATTPGVEVIGFERLRQVLAELGGENLELIDRALSPDFARRTGANALVLGGIYRSGDELRIDARVEDVAGGRVLAAASVRGADVFALVDELTARVRAALRLADPAERLDIRAVTTSSIDAYRQYLKGQEANRDFDLPAAREAFEEAVRLDPDFGLAYAALGRIARFAGGWDAAGPYLERALARADRLPDNERWLLEAEQLFHRGEWQRVAERLETLLERYPDQEEAYLLLGEAYAARLETNVRVLATLERGLARLPRSASLRSFAGYTLLAERRWDDAIRHFEIVAEIRPGSPDPLDSLADAWVIAGRPDKALLEYDRTLQVAPGFRWARTGRMFAFGVLGRYDQAFDELDLMSAMPAAGGPWPAKMDAVARAFLLTRVGRYAEAERILRREWTNTGTLASVIVVELVAAIERDRLDEARTLADQLFETAQKLEFRPVRDRIGLQANIVAGVVAAQASDERAALARLARIQELSNAGPAADAARAWIRAELALAKGDSLAAEREFVAALRDYPVQYGKITAGMVALASLPLADGVGRALAARGDLDGAIGEYRELVSDSRTGHRVALLAPRHVLRLAELLDETGQPEQAVAQYQRFLDLWSRADPGLPELARARSRLRALSSPR